MTVEGESGAPSLSTARRSLRPAKRSSPWLLRSYVAGSGDG